MGILSLYFWWVSSQNHWYLTLVDIFHSLGTQLFNIRSRSPRMQLWMTPLASSEFM